MIGFGDLRSMESLCRHDIRFMYITKEETPSFMSFQRLFNDYLTDDIDHIFFDVCENIGNLMHIDRSVQYITAQNLRQMPINTERGFDFQYHYFYCAQEIGYIVQYLMECMVNNDIHIVYGKGKRKSAIQRWYDLFLEYFKKLEEYEYWLSITGERNSCSKTDHDATMCVKNYTEV